MEPTVPRIKAVKPAEDETLKTQTAKPPEPLAPTSPWRKIIIEPAISQDDNPSIPARLMGLPISRWGIIAAGAVGLVIVVIAVAVFASRGGTLPSISATATVGATATPTPITPGLAWSGAAVTHTSTTLATGETFAPQDVASDGSFIVGTITNSDKTISIVAVTMPSHTVQKLYSPPKDITQAKVATDGRFVVFLGESADYATATKSHAILGYYDLQRSIRFTLFDAGYPDLSDTMQFIGHSSFLWATKAGYRITDMTSFGTTSVNLSPADVSGAVLGAWPYLYENGTDGQAHLYNVQTGKNLILSQPTSNAASGTLSLTSDSLFWAHTTSAGLSIEVYALAKEPGATAITAVTIPGLTTVQGFAADARFFVVNEADRTYVWDRNQARLVTFPLANSLMLERPMLHDTLLWYLSVDGTITLIDSTKLG